MLSCQLVEVNAEGFSYQEFLRERGETDEDPLY